MAELEDGWMPGSDAPVQVEVDKLDFPFVESCNDWKQLYNILRVLRSGKEGFYPDLERTTEQKLLSVMPEKIRRRYLAVKSSATPSQIAEAEDELAQWLSKANMLDEGLKSGRAESHQNSNATGRAHWTLLQSLSMVQANKIAKLQQDLKCSELSTIQLERKAELERRKGNECYRAGEHAAALDHYTRSIAFQDTVAAAWANRAMAYIKTEVFDLAEIDCSVALSLDANYKKARSRRGLVRFKRGKYKEAAEDFQEVVNQSGGTDNEAQSMLTKTLDKFREVEGYALVFDSVAATAPAETLRTVPSTPCETHELFLPVSAAHAVSFGSLFSPPASTEFVRVQIDAESDDESDEDDVHDLAHPPAATAPTAHAADDKDSPIRDTEARALHLKDEGNALVKAGKYLEAIAMYDQSLAAHYSLVTVNNRAQAKLHAQDWHGAIADCDAVLAHEAHNAKAIFRRAKAWTGLRDLQRAQEDLDRVLQAEAGDSSAHTHREHVVSLRAQSEACKARGNAAMEAGDVSEALRCYSEAIHIDHSNWAAWNNRALAHIKTAHFAQAEEDASHVLAGRAAEDLKQKALFRRAEARLRQAAAGHGPEAVDKLTAALQDLDGLRDGQSAAAQALRGQILAALRPPPPVSPKATEREASSLPSCLPPPPPPTSSSSSSSSSLPAAAKAARAVAKAKDAPAKVKVSVPAEPPRTLYEFERVWRSLHSEPGLRAEYLSTFKTATFKRVFKDSIATELLGSVFVALQHSTQPALIARVLGELAKLPMLSFALTMLPREETAALHDVLSRLQAGEGGDAEAVRNLVGLYRPEGPLSGAK